MNYPNVHVMTHPLIQHKISMLRKIETGTKDFHELVHEITLLIGYEASRELPLEEEEIQTPLPPRASVTSASTAIRRRIFLWNTTARFRRILRTRV